MSSARHSVFRRIESAAAAALDRRASHPAFDAGTSYAARAAHRSVSADRDSTCFFGAVLRRAISRIRRTSSDVGCRPRSRTNCSTSK